jgi:site-specific recombinase
MAEKKQVKLKKTAAGAQQMGSTKDIKALMKRFQKDLDKVHNDTMTRAEFKKKYGKTVAETQSMIYAAESAARSRDAEKKPAYKGQKKDADTWEKYWDKDAKEARKSSYAYGGMAKKKTPMKGYNKGGYVKCGASNPTKRKAK